MSEPWQSALEELIAGQEAIGEHHVHVEALRHVLVSAGGGREVTDETRQQMIVKAAAALNEMPPDVLTAQTMLAAERAVDAVLAALSVGVGGENNQ